MIQNKLKELTESSAFLKRVRRKLRQMNITKTQDDLKKKIIKLKMMRLRAYDDDYASSASHHSGKQEDSFDFLSEIVKF